MSSHVNCKLIVVGIASLALFPLMNAGPASARPHSTGALVATTFCVSSAGTGPGQRVYVVGDKPALGSWNPAKGFALKVHGSGKSATWSGSTVLPAGAPVQYKYVKWDGKTADWEADEPTKSKNREVRTPSAGHAIYNDHAFKQVKR